MQSQSTEIATLENLMKESIDSNIKILNIEMLGGGCINAASKVITNQGEFFAKWNSNCPEDLFLREAESLEELALAKSSLKIPKVYAKTALEDAKPAFLITEFLPVGQSNDEQLGEGLAQIHQFQNKSFGFYHNNYCGVTLQDNSWNKDWIDFFGQQRILYLLNLIKTERGISSENERVLEQFIDKLPQLLNHKPKPALVHGDLWSGNYMYSAKGAALIDPCCCYADREYDLSITTMFGGFSQHFWDSYQNAYSLPPEWRERNQIYQVYHHLNHFLLFGGGYLQSALQIVKRFL